MNQSERHTRISPETPSYEAFVTSLLAGQGPEEKEQAGTWLFKAEAGLGET